MSKIFRPSAVWLVIIVSSLLVGYWHFTSLRAEEKRDQPMVVNGDVVEYSTDQKSITATGHVEIIYKGSKLTCEKITVNTLTKEAIAEGHPRLDDKKGVMEGEKITYNFDTKIGTVFNSKFRANPYFGQAKELQKIDDREYMAKDGYATTCNFDQPHYRIAAKQINIFPGDKMQTEGDSFYVGKTPVMYLPRLNRSLKDNFMHGRLMPGSRKDWGPFLLSEWRYNLASNVNGKLYLDYRNKLGFAEGFGINYTTPSFGKGDFKFYYADEKAGKAASDSSDNFQRFFNRWRHTWDIDTRTNFISEVYQISDEKRKIDPSTSFLKDYFYREYEKDVQPLTYALLHHNFQNSSLDFSVQKRINHWFDQLDKLPEVKYALPSLKIGTTPLYFQNSSSFDTFSKKDTTVPVSPDEVDVTRLDTTNKFFLPMRLSILRVSPFVASQQTFYDKGANGQSTPIRSVFYNGVDVSTKFYRMLNVKSNFLGMDLNGLRHIITPTVNYSYNPSPTIPSTNLKQIDSVDAIAYSNVANLELSNKLQTKRKGQSVDLADLRVKTSYVFNPKTGDKHGSNLSDFLFDMTLIPYSWLRLDADATLKHSGNRSDEGYGRIINANYDFAFSFANERSLGIGQRYQRKGSDEVTTSFQWRLNPKWKFFTYHRYNFGHDALLNLKKGWQEQQYGVERDLHCWTAGLFLDTKINQGSTLWLTMRLKAFPESELRLEQSYHGPRSGSQSNP